MIKILHVGYSDFIGGAARASYRVHRALLQAKLDSRMRVILKGSEDPTVLGGQCHGFDRFLWSFKSKATGFAIKSFLGAANESLSLAWHDTGLGKELNKANVDIINLHWLGNKTLSINEIQKIKKPVVWRLADMWAFCGAEHYSDSDRYVHGYTESNRPFGENGIDLNRLTWLLKKKAWKKPINIVCPTSWLADCVKSSALMAEWPVNVIPTSIDLNVFSPVEKSLARSILGISTAPRLILFGAIGGLRDERKGGDLLLESIRHLKHIYSYEKLDFELLVFGDPRNSLAEDIGCKVHFLGHLHDDVTLKLAYSAADVMVIPSRQDNLPGTGLEAHACGTPIVAFKIGGLPEIIQHLDTGYLAKPFDAEDLAQGISWVISDSLRLKELRENARARAELLWSPEVVSNQYINLYNHILKHDR